MRAPGPWSVPGLSCFCLTIRHLWRMLLGMSTPIGSKWLVDGKVMVVRRIFRGDPLPYEVEPLGNLAPANRFRCRLSALKPIPPPVQDPRTPDND